MLKGEDMLTLQIKVIAIGLTVTADSKANVRSYVHNPQVMLPPSPAGKLDVGGAIGSGYINVIKDMGLKPYSSQIDLFLEKLQKTYLLFCDI